MSTMKKRYLAPGITRIHVFLEENIADTTLSIKGATGSVTQDSWDNVDTEIGYEATDPQGDMWLSY
jgi:hypothetical protein